MEWVEDRMAVLQKGIQKDYEQERDDSREVQRGAITLFNESKRHKSEMQSDAAQASVSIDKMRDEVIRIRSKNSDSRDERSHLKQQQEVDRMDSQRAVADRVFMNES